LPLSNRTSIFARNSFNLSPLINWGKLSLQMVALC
jgi:hypothetical protein